MISLKNINKSYKNFQALKNINLEVQKGEVVVLSGVSGSGKSTLLSLIGAMDKPTSGEIVVDGKNIAKLPDLHASKFRLQSIGFIFQSFNLIENFTVLQNVLAPQVPIKVDKKNITQALKQANILHKKDELVLNLSGGEKQRCAIARALVNNPQILLCDEPTANLDKQNTLDFINFLNQQKQNKKIIIVSTHDVLFENLDFVDDVVRIKDGEIIYR